MNTAISQTFANPNRLTDSGHPQKLFPKELVLNFFYQDIPYVVDDLDLSFDERIDKEGKMPKTYGCIFINRFCRGNRKIFP